MDIDKSPAQNGQQIGEAAIPFGILFGKGLNSIIAVNSAKNEILLNAISISNGKLLRKDYLIPRRVAGCLTCRSIKQAVDLNLDFFTLMDMASNGVEAVIEFSKSGGQIDESAPQIGGWRKKHRDSLYTDAELKQIEKDLEEDIIPLPWSNTTKQCTVRDNVVVVERKGIFLQHKVTHTKKQHDEMSISSTLNDIENLPVLASLIYGINL